MAKINERIKERRLASDMTLLEVAEKLDVKEATVQRYESGEIKNIKHDTIVALSKIFNCSPEYLMGWADRVQRVEENINTIAAHKEDNEKWTIEELEKIEEYKELLMRARKNKVN